MAEFNENLGDPNNYKRATGNASQTVDLFGGLANTLGNLARGPTGPSPDPKKARDLQNDAALDELATKANNILQGKPAAGYEGGLPGAGKAILHNMQRLQYSLEGGGIDQTFYDVQMDQLITQMQAKYPESAYELYNAMNEIGIDHYVAREAKAAQAQAAQYTNDVLKRQETYRDAAAKAGAVTPGMSDMEIQQAGATVLRLDRDLKQMTEERTLRLQEMTQENNLTETQRKALEEANTREGQLLTNTIVGRSAVPLGSFVDTAYSLANAAGEDGQMNEDFSESLNFMKQQAIQGRTQAKALAAQLNLTSEQQNHIDKQFSDFIGDIDALASGPTSYVQTTTRNLKLLKDTGTLGNEELFPAYKQLVDGLGQEVTNALLQGTMAGFNPAEVQYIRDEMLRGMSKVQMDASQTYQKLQEYKQILNNPQLPRTTDPAKLGEAVRLKSMALSATLPAVVEGTATKQGYDTWNNSSIGLLSAAEDVQAPTMSPQNVDAMISNVFNAKWLRAADQYDKKGENPDQYNMTMQYSAVVAAKMLDAIKSQNGENLVYDNVSGRFKAAGVSPNQGMMNNALFGNAPGNATKPGMDKTVSQANDLLMFLSNVHSRVDIVPEGALIKEGPEGSERLSDRDVFGSTEGLYEAMQNWVEADARKAATASVGGQARETFYNTLEKLREGGEVFDYSGIERSTRYTGEVERTGNVGASIGQRYVPVKDLGGYLDRTMSWESSGNTNAQSETSSAGGLYGFIDKTWLGVIDDVPEFDGLSKEQKLALKKDPIVARDMAERLAKQDAAILGEGLGRPPSWDELYLAHFFGPSTGYEVITAPKTLPIERFVSKDVIAANPELKGKTVGQARDRLLRRTNGEFEDYVSTKYPDQTAEFFTPSNDWIGGISDEDL